jgi:hypothetical protein
VDGRDKAGHDDSFNDLERGRYRSRSANNAMVLR